MTQRDKELNRAIVIGFIKADQPNFYKQVTFWNPDTEELIYLENSIDLHFERAMENPDYPPYIKNDGNILGSVLIKRMLDSYGQRGRIGPWNYYKSLRLKNPDTGKTFIIYPDPRTTVMSILPEGVKRLPYKLPKQPKKEKWYNDGFNNNTDDNEVYIEKEYYDDNVNYRKIKLSKLKSTRKIKVVKKCKCK